MTRRQHRTLAEQIRRRWWLMLVIFVGSWAVLSVVQWVVAR